MAWQESERFCTLRTPVPRLHRAAALRLASEEAKDEGCVTHYLDSTSYPARIVNIPLVEYL
jgi:hypothetical protein